MNEIVEQLREVQEGVIALIAERDGLRSQVSGLQIEVTTLTAHRGKLEAEARELQAKVAGLERLGAEADNFNYSQLVGVIGDLKEARKERWIAATTARRALDSLEALVQQHERSWQNT